MEDLKQKQLRPVCGAWHPSELEATEGGLRASLRGGKALVPGPCPQLDIDRIPGRPQLAQEALTLQETRLQNLPGSGNVVCLTGKTAQLMVSTVTWCLLRLQLVGRSPGGRRWGDPPELLHLNPGIFPRAHTPTALPCGLRAAGARGWVRPPHGRSLTH